MDLKTYLSELEYLVNIDSGSEDLEGLKKMADFFSHRFRQLGWNVEEYDLAPKSGVCVVCTNRKAEHYDLMLMGHLDTVYPRGTCAQRPFRIEGNRAYGPGVGDMKQGCLLMYYLMKELPREIHDKLNIAVVFNPDEEIGSTYSREIYAAYAKKCDYAFLYEARSAKGEYCVQRKGSVSFTVDFTGVEGHCGYVFKNGARSAISEMAKWIVELDKLQNQERDTTVNVGIASGGTKNNVVAAHASMTANVRFAVPEEADRVKQTLDRLTEQAKERGIGAEIRMGRGKPALNPTPEGRAYFEHITQLARANGIEPLFKARGGLSDANIIAQYGPICMDGMGPSGSDGHCPGEYMLVDTIEPVFDFSKLLIKDLADRKQ